MISPMMSNAFLNGYAKNTSNRRTIASGQIIFNASEANKKFQPYSNTNINSSSASASIPLSRSKNAATPSIINADDRKETSKNYNKILEELRSQYPEQEAMRLFDEIMRADGFELVTNQSVGPNVSSTYSNKINGFAQSPVSLYGNDDEALIHALTSGIDRDQSTNLLLQSNIYGTLINGKPAVSTESWAIFGATRPLSSELQSYWQNRYFDTAGVNADFELGEYMSWLSDSSQRSAVAVNTDIGRMVTDILAANGVELESGEYLDFELNDDFGIMVHTNSKHDLQGIFNDSSELHEAMKAQAKSPLPESVSQLAGSYDDGERSVSYTFNRYFTYSADEPSAVVMNDFLGVMGSGYTYAKKAGDYFDPNAESFNTGQQIPVTTALGQNQDDFHANVSETYSAVNQHIAKAIKTGVPVEGNASRQAIENEKARGLAADRDYWANMHMFELSRGNASSNTSSAKIAESSQGKNDNQSTEQVQDSKHSGYTAKSLNSSKRDAMNKIVETLRSRYSTLFIQKPTIATMA